MIIKFQSISNIDFSSKTIDLENINDYLLNGRVEEKDSEDLIEFITLSPAESFEV